MRRGPRPEKSKEAKPSVARKSGKATGARGRDLEESLAEALRDKAEAQEQQAATAEILRVIASSPTDLQFVFDTIVRTAARLCDAFDANLVLADGDELVQRAHHGPISAPVQNARFPLRGTVSGQAISEARIIHVADLAAATEYPLGSELAQRLGYRTTLIVPLVRDGRALGAIGMRRTEVKLFTERQIELLKTFAAQAVIAIENVRFLTELQSSNRDLTTALDKQTATSDILRIIAGSQTDAQPVFNAIVSSAVCLLGGYTSSLSRVIDNHVALVALTSSHDEADAALRARFPQPLDSREAHAQTIRARAPLNIADAVNDPRLPEVQQTSAYARGFRSLVLVPLIHQDAAIGAIGVSRREPGGFTGDEIALLQTFADQAVIAIENVRLFKELEARNRELTTALDTQTATADVLRIISRSKTDVQPVFDAIVSSAVRLLAAYAGGMSRVVGDQIELVALVGSGDAEADAAMRASVPQGGLHAQTIRNRTPLNVADAETDLRVPEVTRVYARSIGYRSQVVVPMLRHDEAIGAIAVMRREPGGFTNDEIALLQTFADQAVIAIENARLLTELQDRTHALTRSVDQLTALGDVGRAVSSSLDLDTVLATIVGRAVELSGTDGGTIFEYDEGAQEFSARATLNADQGQSALLRTTRLRRGEGAVGQMAVMREPFQIPDIAAEGAYASRIRGAMLASGTRSVLAIPLLHEDRLVGGLVVTRRAAGAFTDDVVALLRTFATQSALAIQNARLFREIEEKSRELAAASQHKSEFLANMSHELRTPLNAIIGFSEVLSDRMFGELNEKQEEYLKDIYASGTHLLSLINDILDLSKIEAGRMELELTHFDLPTAIENALLLVRERAGRRSIALHANIDNRLGQIQADERKVRQVVLNLLSNAIKFTPEGGSIEVAAASKDGSVEVSVSDTGIGIAHEDQEKVFEEFRQVGTAAKKVEGTGLGLTLCRKFVELHGGRIWVQSQLGAGSTFTFSLPQRSP